MKEDQLQHFSNNFYNYFINHLKDLDNELDIPNKRLTIFNSEGDALLKITVDDEEIFNILIEDCDKR